MQGNRLSKEKMQCDCLTDTAKHSCFSCRCCCFPASWGGSFIYHAKAKQLWILPIYGNECAWLWIMCVSMLWSCRTPRWTCFITIMKLKLLMACFVNQYSSSRVDPQTSVRKGVASYDLAKFCKKPYEIEKFFFRAPLNPPLCYTDNQHENSLENLKFRSLTADINSFSKWPKQTEVE